MTVKKSPSESSRPPLTEEDTFNRLRRKPVSDVFAEFIFWASTKEYGDVNDEEIEQFLIERGWTSVEFNEAYRGINPCSQI